MRITELRIENVKKISAMEITPDGKPVILTGDNEQGKSSVLDALFLALKNKGLVDPIKRGAKKAKINLTIAGHEDGEIYLERVYTAKGGHRLKLTDEKNRQIPKAQAFIDALVGTLAFDPTEFIRMDDKKRIVTLRTILGLDFTDLDKRAKEKFDERAFINREKKNLDERLKAMDRPEGDFPSEPVSATDLVKERDEMVARLERLKELEGTADTMEQSVAMMETQVDELRKKISDRKAELDSISKDIAEAKSDAPTSGDINEITERLETVEATNNKIRAAAQFREVKGAFREKEKQSDELTEELAEIVEKKKKMIADADFPVEGMAFEDDDVTLNGIVFSQLSHGEQIRVSSLVAMSQHPDLGILIIRDGALLNDENRKVIFDIAEKRGFEDVYEERFQPEPGKEGLHITDGSITHKDGKEISEDGSDDTAS